MSKIRLYGDTSGYVDLTTPAVADNSSIDISNPTFSGNVSANGTITSGVDNNSYMRVGRYSSGYGGSALNTYGGSSFLSVQVEGLEAIKANSAGHVTMPYQPMYSGQQNGGTYSSGQAIPFATVTINNGSHFNTTNGRFTAPVTGNYFVACSFLSPQSSATIDVRIRKNGTGGFYGGGYSGEGVSSYKHGGAMAVVPMSANDYVEVIAVNSGAAFHNDPPHNTLNIFLLG